MSITYVKDKLPEDQKGVVTFSRVVLDTNRTVASFQAILKFNLFLEEEEGLTILSRLILNP